MMLANSTFLSKLNDHVVTVLTPKMTPPSPVDGIPFELLWYNSYVTHNSNIIMDTVIQQLSVGLTQVKHLCEMKSYEPQFRSEGF